MVLSVVIFLAVFAAACGTSVPVPTAPVVKIDMPTAPTNAFYPWLGGYKFQFQLNSRSRKAEFTETKLTEGLWLGNYYKSGMRLERFPKGTKVLINPDGVMYKLPPPADCGNLLVPSVDDSDYKRFVNELTKRGLINPPPPSPIDSASSSSFPWALLLFLVAIALAVWMLLHRHPVRPFAMTPDVQRILDGRYMVRRVLGQRRVGQAERRRQQP